VQGSDPAGSNEKRSDSDQAQDSDQHGIAAITERNQSYSMPEAGALTSAHVTSIPALLVISKGAWEQQHDGTTRLTDCLEKTLGSVTASMLPVTCFMQGMVM